MSPLHVVVVGQHPERRRVAPGCPHFTPDRREGGEPAFPLLPGRPGGAENGAEKAEQQVAALTVWRLTSRRCTRSPARAISLRKQVFCLRTGRCLDAPGMALPVFDVRIRDGVTRLSIPGNTDETAVGA